MTREESLTRDSARKVALSIFLIFLSWIHLLLYSVLNTNCLTLSRGWGYNHDRSVLVLLLPAGLVGVLAEEDSYNRCG